MTSPPKARKQPRQSRSQLLVEAIQQACVMILEQEGPESLTTQRIADVAGINIASLYRYFPNKEAVLAEVFEQKIARFEERARASIGEIERLSHESLEQTLAAIIDMEVDQRLELQQLEPEFYRVYQQSLDFHRRINELSVSMDNMPWEAWFPELLRRHQSQLRHDDLQLASHVARSALEGMLDTALAELPDAVSIDALKTQMLALLLRYLLK